MGAHAQGPSTRKAGAAEMTAGQGANAMFAPWDPPGEGRELTPWQVVLCHPHVHHGVCMPTHIHTKHLNKLSVENN